MFMKHYAPIRCEPSIEALNFRGRGDQGRCERRREVFVKIHFFFGGGDRFGGGGGHGRCEQRSEVFLKIQFFFFFFFFFWGGGGGVGYGGGGGGSGWM